MKKRMMTFLYSDSRIVDCFLLSMVFIVTAMLVATSVNF